MVTRDHYIDLVDGRFDKTTRQDLSAAFKTLTASNKDHLIVHFHGGLVSRLQGHEAADGLTRYYNQNAYPLFFIWNSDLLSVLGSELKDALSGDLFKALFKRALAIVVAKAVGKSRGEALDLSALPAQDVPELANQAQVDAQVKNQELEGALAVTKPLSGQEEAQIQAAFLRDPELVRLEASILEQTLDDSKPRSGRTTLGVVAPRMQREVVAEAGIGTGKTRALVSASTLVTYLLKIARAVIWRYVCGRDHGLPATCVEEVARALYLSHVGTEIWSAIKRDAEAAFIGDASVAGGLAFIEELGKWWAPGKKVTLVGHSTGAIYIGHLLESMDKGQIDPALKVNVVFLAGACTFGFLFERLSIFQRRVSGIRNFGLSDAKELGYWEIPGLYPASLLYLVSGLCEVEPGDTPLIGMERYFKKAKVYDGRSETEVRAYFGQRLAWADHQVSDPGWSTTAKTHGDFDNNVVTRDSLAAILRDGL